MRPGEGKGEAPVMRFTKQVLTASPHLSTCPGTEATRAPAPLTPRGKMRSSTGPCGTDGWSTLPGLWPFQLFVHLLRSPVFLFPSEYSEEPRLSVRVE